MNITQTQSILGYSLGLLIPEKPVLRSVVFHKYSIEFPKDWDYGIIVRRLYFCCQELLNKGILSTYLVREEEKLPSCYPKKTPSTYQLNRAFLKILLTLAE